MAVRRMERRAADNVYLHRDFHGALNCCLTWLERHGGPTAAREYLQRFAAAWYAPLTRDVSRRGISAIRDHIERIYRTEGVAVSFQSRDNDLLVEIPFCPAISWMHAHQIPVSPLFFETTRTVYQTICKGTGTSFAVLRYDPETGAARLHFWKEA